jgi:hypothetical protein
MIYFCGQQNRRELVLHNPALNGIDYLEVLGSPGCGTQLAVTFLRPAQSLGLTPANISITGGTLVQAVSVSPATAQDPYVVTIGLDRTGDFSAYTLALVAGPTTGEPPAGLDPQLSSAVFSFKAGCPSPADCLPGSCCPPARLPQPDINYLAKDYDGFRQVLLDRLAVLTPAWTETHAADLGIAIAEVLAYAADHLSYQQDAVSTEAYLDTARSRISLRRHARLVDYQISEGSNARTLVAITITARRLTVPAGTLFYVSVPGLPPAAVSGGPVARQLAAGTQPVFMSMRRAVAHTVLNSIDFYTWGDSDCCLPSGATEATLAGTFRMLRPGDMLIFEEVRGPLTGQPEDADPAHRCAVCLTSVIVIDDQGRPLTDPAVDDPATGQPKRITRITWSAADALPFPLCISSTTDAGHGSLQITVSVAHGNIVPADHGICIPAAESLGTVPPAPPAPDPGARCSCGTAAPAAAPRPRFYPGLAQSPLTFSAPLGAPASAAAFLAPDSADLAADVTLTSDDGNTWYPVPDLLSADGTDPFFVPEIETDGSVYLRFGDGEHGLAPDTGLAFTARYRVGNGTAGNIGRDALVHAVLPAPENAVLPAPPIADITAVRNPLPATGGTDPEAMTHIRQFAPFSYQTQRRCVTEADYGQQAAQSSAVREARGTFRWTGSWYTAFTSIDPVTALTPQLIGDTASRLNMLRMMGTDIAVEGAVIVGLRIELEICVAPRHFQGEVYQALMGVFITGDQCDGRSGLLNPANFTFGQTVYASPLIAAAQAVEGVLSATLTVFTRMDAPWVNGVAQGYLTMGRLDIPRCDNDPDHLDHGIFVLHMDGGK